MGSTVERGYGAEHRALKEFYRPLVDAGEAFCTEPECINPGGRWIRPGTAWALSHTPDRKSWRGPSHALCNAHEAGKRGNPRGVPKRRRVTRWSPTRDW